MPARTARTDRPSEAPLTKTEWERLKTRLTAVDPAMLLSHGEAHRVELTFEFGFSRDAFCECCGADIYEFTVQDWQSWSRTYKAERD